ncbi:MAG TPA: FKBP-type peptidyl-prolyl cis-trans isomerase [Gracilimonas sp.]|uniref:FKBP-type peptidyl-prolyl cis-trans isomerase n=1 Tax=Gracilimonas sp. TaxID=1974203 RepID=UPI002D988F14|nr:FKBP-type peptidyl-prolyl cis-trans isomerase [Gracilimonas sp.]
MTLLKNIFSVFILFLLTVSISSCDESNPFEVDYSDAPEPFDIENTTMVESESGLVYYIVEEGSGAFEVEIRDAVRVYYTGRKVDTGEIFDSSYRNGNQSPTTFNSLDNLIEGFREGLIGMKEGEKRVLIIPPDLGYGDSPNSSLRNDTLRFDVELAAILSN